MPYDAPPDLAAMSLGDIADALGSWWEDRRQIIQPSEFILGPDNKVIASSYADGPLGRMQADDVVKLINFYESR